MRYLHTMIRVFDLPAAQRFFCDGLGLKEVRRSEQPQGRFTLVFLASDATPDAQIELTHNWDQAGAYTGGRNFGHLAFEVDDIYATCRRMQDLGYLISRPPRDGRMAFIRSPDRISVELLQKPPALAAAEPWSSMPNSGEW